MLTKVPVTTDANNLLVRSITLGGLAGLAGEAEIRLSSGRTVLIGKNGAGKSLLMYGACGGAKTARIGSDARANLGPVRFRCEVGTSAAAVFTYEYRLEARERRRERPSSPGGARRVWQETCTRADGKPVWSIKNHTLEVQRGGKKVEVTIPEGIGLLSLLEGLSSPPPEAQKLSNILAGFAIVPAGVLRVGASDESRSGMLFVAGKRVDGKVVWEGGRRGRLGELALGIVLMSQEQPQLFAEFEGILARLHVCKNVTVRMLEAPGPDDSVVALIQLGDDYLGHVSDGTLRVAEMVHALLRGKHRVLFIEEPETSLHPGLLERLLNEFGAYVVDRQVVISTHSPFVVNACAPEEFRLVERINNLTTTIRPFAMQELKQIDDYLRDEGALDDFLFRHEDEEDE
jgi:predicted ATPase